MITIAVLFCLSQSLPIFADSFENETVTVDAVGTIGYLDDTYFTLVTKPDYSKAGESEIGFERTDALEVPHSQKWEDIHPGTAVRVTYEEVRLKEETAFDKEVGFARQTVFERRAIRLVIGQKETKKPLVS